MDIDFFTIGFTQKSARELFTRSKKPGSNEWWTFDYLIDSELFCVQNRARMDPMINAARGALRNGKAGRVRRFRNLRYSGLGSLRYAETSQVFGLIRVFFAAVLCCILGSHSMLASENTPAAFTIAPSGGLFASNPVVSIIASTNQIRYTLDGSLPTTNSALYAAPFAISNSCLLHARGFASGQPTGSVAAANFTLLETNVGDFNSTLPLIVIQTFGHSIQAETNVTASMRFSDVEAGRRTNLIAPCSFDGLAVVKIRGYTSRRYPKHSFSVELRDSEGDAVQASLLRLPKDSEWILYAPYPDKSLIRDALAYELSNQMGHYASRTRFVELFLNETTNRLSRTNYAGVYVLEEKIKRSEHRVNIQKLAPTDKTEPAITGGYIFKKDHLEQLERNDPPPPPPAAALAHPRLGRVGFPTGPGNFPAEPAGFLPPREDTTTITNIVTTTNIAQITNVVAVTNFLWLTNVVAATNIAAVTNIIILTNQLAVPNLLTTRQIATVTTIVSVTNIASLTNVASLTNKAPFPGVVNVTNISTFTNLAAFTNLANVTNTTVATNSATQVRIASITNVNSLTNVAAVTNIAAATNVELTLSLAWATNLIFTTNFVIVTNTSLASTGAPVVEPLQRAPAILSAHFAPDGKLLLTTTNAAPAKPPLLTRLVETGQGFVSSRTNAFFYIEPKPKNITPEQRAWLSNFVNQFETALYGQAFRDPAKGYANFIDVESFIDHHLIVEATKNIDGFRFSTFFTKDRGGKLKMEPIWDWDLAFGNASGKQGEQFEHWYWPQLDDRQYSWFRRLFDDPDFGQGYVDRWAVLRTNVFATSNLLPRVDSLAAFLKEPAARNFERWPILGQTINTEPFSGKSYQEEVVYLKTWISNRLAWVDAQFLPPPVAQPGETVVASGSSLVLTSTGGRVYFTTDGTDPRQSGGAVSSTARAFEQPLIVTNAVQLFVRTQKDNRWSSPLKAKVTIRPTATASKSK